MSSSVIVFAGPCVMMRCGGGSAFGSGSFAGGGLWRLLRRRRAGGEQRCRDHERARER
jgi:hypothetical protein